MHMPTRSQFTPEHCEGRDGEEQQPRQRAASATVTSPRGYRYPYEEDQQRQQEAGGVCWVHNDGRQRLDSRPAEPRRASSPAVISAPPLLRITRGPTGMPSARENIHAAPVEIQENVPGRKSSSSRGSSPRARAVTPLGNERKSSAYARLMRESARKLGLQTPSTHAGSVRGKSSPRGLESGRYGRPSVTTATAASTIPPSTSRTTSVTPELSHGGKKLTAGHNHREESEVTTARNPIVGRQEGVSVSNSRRVVQQAEPIQRDKEQHTKVASASGGGDVGRSSKKESRSRPKRLLAPNDILWKRERRHRRSLSGEQGNSTVMSPQLVVEVPELPSALEVALSDHYLATLMACGATEVRRVVGAVAPNDFQEVLQQLRQMYGEARPVAYAPSGFSRRESQGKIDRRTEWLETHRRHLTGTIRSIAQCSGSKTDGVNGMGATCSTTKSMRKFLRIFTREVSMNFMDECCALCADRWDQVRAEQPREVRARGVAVPDDVLDACFTQVLSRLLSCMLGWTDKESGRVMHALIVQVKRHLPRYGRILLSEQA